MNYRGTIAYRAGLGGNVPEGFLASVVPAWDFLVREYYKSMDNVLHQDLGKEKPEGFHFMRGLSCMLHDSANQIADGFLGDWVLMLDTDHVFASDAFYEMVTTFEENDLDILTGFAQKRQPPYTPLLYKTDFDPLKPFEVIIPEGAERHTLVPIDASGCACLMVRRRVFDAIKNAGERPFDMRRKFNNFDLKTHKPLNIYGVSSDLDYLKLPEDRHIDEVFWEDVSFFWRAHMLGFKPFAAPWIKFHHIETRLVTDDLIQRPKPSEIPE